MLALIPAIFGGVLVFIGLVFWLICRFMNRGYDRTVTGRVVSYTDDYLLFNAEQGYTDPKPRMRAYVTGGMGYHRMVHKVYTYTVGTQTYTRADGVSYSSNLAKSAIGKEVTVSYDSAEPGRSALVSGNAFTIVYRILFALGGVLLLVAALMWLC